MPRFTSLFAISTDGPLPLAVNISIRRQRRQIESIPHHSTAIITPTRRHSNRLQRIRSRHDPNPIRCPILNPNPPIPLFPRILTAGCTEIDQPTPLQEREHLVEHTDVADQRFANLRESEPSRRVFPELGDDEVSVVSVYFGRSSEGAPVEELSEVGFLGVVDVVPGEPACGEREN